MHGVDGIAYGDVVGGEEDPHRQGGAGHGQAPPSHSLQAHHPIHDAIIQKAITVVFCWMIDGDERAQK